MGAPPDKQADGPTHGATDKPSRTVERARTIGETRPERITVVGAGIAGLGAALALSRHPQFEITVLERDAPPPVDGDPFFAWPRRGAAQFRHPHAFLGLLCNLLAEHYPDLLEELLQAGARRLSFTDLLPPKALAAYKSEPDDEALWMLLVRRATVETTLRRYVERCANVSIRSATRVTGVKVDPSDAVPRVLGLDINRDEALAADFVVDACGRNSRLLPWLRASGIDIPERREAADIVYYTRHYRLRPGADEPPRQPDKPSAGDLGYLKYGCFPADQGHFALILCLPLAETALRDAIKQPKEFDRICRAIPGLAPWLDGRSEPTTEPFGIGDITAVWRDWVVDDVPQVLNYLPVGDAALRTNPLYGRGCSTSMLHAHLLADTLAATRDPHERALRFAAATREQLRPIWRASFAEDRRGKERAVAEIAGSGPPRPGSIKEYLALSFGDALAAAAREDIGVIRGLQRTVNLLEKPGAFLETPKTRRTIFRYMLRGRRRNARSRLQPGPDRATMHRLIDAEPPQVVPESSQTAQH